MSKPRDWPQLRADMDVPTAIKVLRIISEDRKLEHGRSTPLVFDDEYKLVGFVHLVNLLKEIRHVCEPGKAPDTEAFSRVSVPVRNLTTSFVGTVTPDQGILDALDIMLYGGVSIVPVLKEGRLEGLVKLSDIFNTVSALLCGEPAPDERAQLMEHFRF
jgi:CBS-domain-containing membrane protein